MGHDHGHASAATAGARHRRPLLIAFALTAAYMVVELVTGLVTGSLALLSDAAHMGTDVLGLGMALAAITLAQRQATSQRTYGTYRLEVLAALANGILLFGVAGYVLYEAWQRFASPPAVPGLPVRTLALALPSALVRVPRSRPEPGPAQQRRELGRGLSTRADPRCTRCPTRTRHTRSSARIVAPVTSCCSSRATRRDYGGSETGWRGGT